LEKQNLKEKIEKFERELCESDNEQAYPQLTKKPGSPFAQIPKKILACSTDQIEGDANVIYYLCSWHQDYK